MTLQDLKCWPEFFEAMICPDPLLRKTLEIRKNDRNFQVWDALQIREWNPETGMYTGRVVNKVVTHIVDRQPWLPEGYVAMSLIDWKDAIAAGYAHRIENGFPEEETP